MADRTRVTWFISGTNMLKESGGAIAIIAGEIALGGASVK
jgi:hypothetical protein